jgi:hypothetical protein
MGGYGSTTDRATGGTKKPPEGGLLGYFVISLEKVSEKWRSSSMRGMLSQRRAISSSMETLHHSSKARPVT